MKLKNVLIFIFAIGIFSSCKREIKYLKTASGLEYFYFEKSDTGIKGKPGYYYLVDMIGQREDDSVFVNSYTLGQNIKLVRTRPPFHSLFNDGLGMLKIGDSIIFRMKADSFFKPIGQPTPAYLKPGEMVRFTVKVKDILSPEGHLMKMYIYELDKMVEYLKLKKWNYATDTTGIKYEVVKKGNSIKAKPGDEAEVSYLLTYLNGTIIDRTKPGDKNKVIVGSPDYISGLNRLIMLADEGSKVQAIIPFAEAFGEDGSDRIDPYATIVIELEILKINKK
ncbi:MAG: FKBP-type peptidyl-prolyl cis-trans isomerase [Bacteroidia bacterium]